MALMNCPVCHKKVSDRANQCHYCGVDLTGDGEALARWRRIEMIKKHASITTQSFASLTLLVGAITLFFWGADEPTNTERYASYTLGGLGGLFYVVSRVRLFLLKRVN